MTTTYYARVDYTYSGGSKLFTIPFSYLKEAHIKVYVNDTATTNFTFNTTSQIQVNDTLTSGDVVSIRRSTPIDSRMVTFTNTSILNKDNQNTSAQQTFNMVQEIYDNNTTFEIKVEADIDDIEDDVDTANTNASTALSNSSTAISTANAASSNASAAVTTANTASSNASQAVSTANSANTTATAANTLSNQTSARVDEFEEDIEEVLEAAEKINELEEAVATAVAKANQASQSAAQAVTAASTASTAATTATQKASEISASATQISTNTTNIATLTTNQGTITDLTTTASTLVGAINELDAENGDLSTLTTEVKTTLVASINNLNSVHSAKISALEFMAKDIKAPCLNFLKAGSTHTKLKIVGGTGIKFTLGTTEYLYKTSDNVEIDASTCLDTGSLQAGKDYCVYICPTDSSFEFKVSLNSTYPSGYSSTTAYKIGGFHTLCVSVTSSNAPALKTGSYFSAHPAIGYNASEIIPNSVWCLTHRPFSEANGMVYVDKLDKWVDIYLQSGTYSSTASVYGASTTDTRQPILHQFDMICVGKKMPTDNDFMVFAEGSNNLTAISGAADPVTTGGHLDSAGKRMISGYFIEDCCGALWQWLDEIAPVGGSGWSSYGTNATDRGQSYGMPYVLRAGGYWDNSSSCGSWSRYCVNTRSATTAYVGCRGVSRSLFSGKVA